jgi:hypothetical protein
MRMHRLEPERQELKVDFSELEWAFEDHNEFGLGHWYLDRESGYVAHVSQEAALEAERLVMNLSEGECAEPNIVERLLGQADAPNCEEYELRDQLIIELSEPDRFISIDARPSYEAFKDMEAFIETVADIELRDRLLDALDRRRPFRRFKDVLIEFPEEQQQWYAFQNARLREHIVEWLHDEGIEPIAAEPGERVELMLHGGD